MSGVWLSEAGNTAKLNAAISSIRSGFSSLTKTPFRELVAVAPAVTSGAATSMVGTPIVYTLGYQSPTAAFSMAGFHPLSGNTNQAVVGDNVTTNYALTTFTSSTGRIAFVHTGQILELQFQSATTNIFLFKIDGKFESLTPTTETNAFRKYDFGSSATRDIQIISAGLDLSTFHVVKVNVSTGDTVVKGAIKGPRCILFGDSFCSNPSSFPLAFAETMHWDDVWGSGVGGSGYIATNGNTVPTFAMRIQHDVIQYAPKVVGIIGSVNDNSQTYAALYAAAYSLYTTLTAALPNSLIFAAHTSSKGVDGEAITAWRNRAAKKAAATAAGIMWVDITSQPNDVPLLSGVTAFTNSSGASTLYLDIAWDGAVNSNSPIGSVVSLGDEAGGTGERHLILSTAQNSGKVQANLAGPLLATYAAGSAWTLKGSSYLTGTGKVGTTTGVGNSDTLCSSDGVHPSYPAGQDALGIALASNLINAIIAAG
jgi:hypothetical protein